MSETVNKIAVLSSAIKHALLADVQYYEFHASSAFNRKMKGIITPGFYGGFEPALAGGLNLKITSLQGPGGHGVASIDVNNHQITVQQIEDVMLAIPVNGVTRVILEANYQYGVKTSQVDDSSDIHAALIFTANISVPLAENHLEICRVTVPADATELTLDMIDSSHRQNKALGITLSSKTDSDAEHIGASSNAVKKAVKAACDETKKQIKELVDGAPEELDTLAELAEALGNDPKFATTMLNNLTDKQPLDDTLTNLSGKDVADLLQYLGFGSFPQYQMLGAKQHIIQHGSGAANSSGIADIVFPKAFTTTSNLNVTATATSQQPANYIVTVGTITTTGVRLYLTGANAGATPVAAAIGFHWKAEGR